MPGIIWLASYPKSGNTWTRAFLANYMRNPDRPIPINDLPNHILGDNFVIHYEQFTGRKMQDIGAEEVHQLRPQIHMWFATSRGEDVFVKTHSALLTVHGVPLITPQATAGAIYIVRNPMDVAVSAAHHFQTTIDQSVENLCDPKFYLPPHDNALPQVLCDWTRHIKSWTEAPGLTHYLMRYEDMRADALRSFSGLISFLGLPPEPLRLKKAVDFSSFDELKKQESRGKFVESRPDGKAEFFREGKIGGWREKLTDAHVSRLIDVHGEMMRKLGYLTPEGELTV